jgi:hypothetical protein
MNASNSFFVVIKPIWQSARGKGFPDKDGTFPGFPGIYSLVFNMVLRAMP